MGTFPLPNGQQMVQGFPIGKINQLQAQIVAGFPAGVGSELQYRATGSTFGALGGSSVSGSTATINTLNLTNALGISFGGTGQTSANAAFNALAPSQGSNTGKFLTTDGTNTSWATISSGGTPAGSTGDIQFNSSGAFGADDANLFWDNSNKRLGIGTNAPDAQAHYKIATSTLLPPTFSPSIQGGFTSNYFAGDTITYRMYSYATLFGVKYYSSTYTEHSQFITNDGDSPSLEIGTGYGDGTVILRDINGGGFNDATFYSISGTFIDDNSQTWPDPTTVTPDSFNVSTRINYNNGTNVFGFHTESNVQVNGVVRIGSDAPSDSSAPFSVVNNSSGGEARLGFFETKQTSERGEFTIANSGNTSWTNNFMSIMNHGSTYASNYYTDHDAGSSIFLLQGANAYQLSFATYNSQPINFWIGGTKKLNIASGGITMTDNLTISTKNIITDTTTGTKIGTSTTQKLGFFNKTPVVQPSAYTPSNVTTDRSYNANSTTLDEVADVLGTLIADLQSLGLIG